MFCSLNFRIFFKKIHKKLPIAASLYFSIPWERYNASQCIGKHYNFPIPYYIKRKLNYTRLKYLPFSDPVLNVINLVDNPPNLTNYWHLKFSVHLSVTLDGKEGHVCARDLLKPISANFPLA